MAIFITTAEFAEFGVFFNYSRRVVCWNDWNLWNGWNVTPAMTDDR
jgi:hypothetical protein